MVKKVFLNGTIGEEITNSMLIEALQGMTALDTVVFMVNSGGGSILEALAMYNTLQSTPANTVFRIVALAGSAMTYVMLAAKKIEMAKNAKLLIHSVEGYPSGRGTADNLEQTAEIVRKFDNDLISAYAKKTGKEEKYIQKNYVNGSNLEVWLTSEQALSEGFVDEVVNSFTEIPLTAYANTHFLNQIVQTQIGRNQMELEQLKAENTALKNALAKSIEALAQSKGIVGNQLEIVKLAASADHEKALTLIAQVEPPAKEDVKQEKIETALPLPQLVSLADLTKAFQGNAKQDERSTWNIKDWEANDPQGLQKIIETDLDRYDAIVRKSVK